MPGTQQALRHVCYDRRQGQLTSPHRRAQGDTEGFRGRVTCLGSHTVHGRAGIPALIA